MRKIALSNISLVAPIPVQILSPAQAWKQAHGAGFDALKINPLRGWDALHILTANIPVTTFEAPWNTDAWDSAKQLLKGRVVGFLVDVRLFGYKSADRRAREYGLLFSNAIGVDCPDDYEGNFIRSVETGLGQGTREQIYAAPRITFDTWHMREFSDGFTFPGFKPERVVSIDVQTRDKNEWWDFLQGKSCLLSKQLKSLAELPSHVSAALEINPLHLYWLYKKGSYKNRFHVLSHLRQQIRQYVQ